MRASFFLLPILGSLLLAGCGSISYMNHDPAKNNQAQYDKDYAECRLAGIERGAGSLSSWYSYCMQAKGWKTIYK